MIGRTRKDGSTAYTARTVIKKGGVIAHRESETFDRKQAANKMLQTSRKHMRESFAQLLINYMQNSAFVYVTAKTLGRQGNADSPDWGREYRKGPTKDSDQPFRR